MIDGDTEPLILDEAGGSSEFGSDGSNNASDEMAGLNEEADLPIEMLRARYQQAQSMPAPTVEHQSRSDTKNDAELASILSAPSPFAVQATSKEGRTTPSLRSSYLRSSSAVSMESGRSLNSSPSLEGTCDLQSIFDNNNSDNDADYEPVLKKRKRKEIRIGNGYQADIPMQVSDQVPITETEYFEMPPCTPPGLPQPICHKLPNSNPNSHWKSNGHSAFQPVKNNKNQQKPQQINKSPQSDSSNYLKASQASTSTSIASLSPHQSRLPSTSCSSSSSSASSVHSFNSAIPAVVPIPQHLQTTHKVPTHTPSRPPLETCQWKPHTIVQGEILDDFLKTCWKRWKYGAADTTNQGKQLSAGSEEYPIPDSELLLKWLYESDYDVSKSIDYVHKYESKTNNSQQKYFLTQTLWDQGDIDLFEMGIKSFGKNFSKIRLELLKNKSTKEIVDFYYRWKFSDRKRDFVNRGMASSGSSGLGNTSHSKKSWKKMGLDVQGDIDYMRHLIDEQQNKNSNKFDTLVGIGFLDLKTKPANPQIDQSKRPQVNKPKSRKRRGR